jgi:2-amino-4-hydroxy-6-hydroxymethyldihydropteridine diphosphokinase
MAEAFIGLGSNLGDGRKNLQKAWARLGEHPDISLLSLSSPYRTKPVNMDSIQWFTNAVGMVETDLPPAALLSELLRIEEEMGRDRTTRNRDRTVDMDILYYENEVLSSPELILPHPEIQNRLFVLAPLEELDPDRRHPVLLKTSARMRMLLRSTDQEIIKSTWLEGN